MKRKMNKKSTAAAIVAGTLAASAVFLPGCNMNTNLYGPPPEDLSSEFDPAENVTALLYGPPSIISEDEEETTTDPVDAAPSFTPEENSNAPLYGPPPAQR